MPGMPRQKWPAGGAPRWLCFASAPPAPPAASLSSPPPRCEIVLHPQMNHYNEVTRTGLQRVCVTRGVYADHFWPYAPPYWRPNPRQGYGNRWWPGS
jgi:hypothetical protein